MKIRYDLFLSRQSLMHSLTFINVYETTVESETARIWPRRHVQSLESSGLFLLHNSHITYHPSLHRRPFLTLITILHPPPYSSSSSSRPLQRVRSAQKARHHRGVPGSRLGDRQADHRPLLLSRGRLPRRADVGGRDRVERRRRALPRRERDLVRGAARPPPLAGEAAGDGLEDHLAGIQEGHDGVVSFEPSGLVAKDGRTRRKKKVEDGKEGVERPAMDGRIGGQERVVRIMRQESTA